MSLCKRNLTAFQRRSIQLIGSMLGFCVAIGVGPHVLLERHHFSTAAYFGIAVLATIPIIGTLIIISRYLAGEKDEYLRSLVVQSILWGFGVVMIVDTLLAYLVEYHSIDIPFGLFNMEIFIVTAAIALRIQLWRNR
jgi:hypothetical protein